MNAWKYNEVKKYIGIHKMRQGGCDLNRIDGMDMTGFIKIAIIGDFIRKEELQIGAIR